MFQIPASYYSITGGRESGNNPSARNPRSSASGQFQFLDSTYLNHARRLAPGVDDQSLMARKNDPQFQRQVMEDFTQENAQALTDRGLPTTPGNLYLAHFLGAGGARKALTSPDDASVEAFVGPEVVAANPHLKGMNVAQLKQWADSKYGEGAENPADLPAPGAQEASSRGGLFQAAAGERGPLFGTPETADFGDGLIGVGAAMMARDNPQAASVLLASVKKDKNKRTGTDTRSYMNQGTGELVTIDARTGSILNKEQVAPKPEKPVEKKPMSAAALKIIEGNRDAAETASQVYDKMNRYRDMIANGQLDVTVASRMGNNFREFLNASDQNTRNAAVFMADMEDMRNARLLEAKGVQTEGDAQRAMSAIVPGFSGYDNKTMLSLLDRAAGDLGKAYTKHSGKYSSVVGNLFKDYDPDGLTLQDFAERGKRFETFETEFAPRRDKFIQSGSQPTTSTATPTGTSASSLSPAAQAAIERHKKRIGAQ